MRRDCQRNNTYWDRWINFEESTISETIHGLKNNPVVPFHRACNLFDLARDHWHLMLLRYSRGDAISELSQYFPGILTYWELSNSLFAEIGRGGGDRGRWNGPFLNWYQISFWLVGLALTLNIPDDQWQRLLAIIGNEGEDRLLDQIIATRQPGRKIGATLCHPKPYARLLAAVEAPANLQARKLATFVKHWYRELKRRQEECGPYWYRNHEDSDDWGSYFGQWCIEAVAVVKAFGLDDRLCLGHPHYPGDLLRPNGPTTHPPCPEQLKEEKAKSWLASLKERISHWLQTILQ
ncbi:MAG: PoNe immunity protein domain-containing protein [Candidatus Symbiodolus clandestinus]